MAVGYIWGMLPADPSPTVRRDMPAMSPVSPEAGDGG